MEADTVTAKTTALTPRERSIIKSIALSVREKFYELSSRIDALQAEMSVLRAAAKGIRYRDLWQQQPYETGDCVTFGGCMWIALKDTQAKPGTSDDWRLAVKKGRDGRDAR